MLHIVSDVALTNSLMFAVFRCITFVKFVVF